MNKPCYVIISPARDEEKHIRLTLDSVINQTHKPILWIIVDDGSIDKTAQIVERYAKVNQFIRLIHRPRIGARQPGTAVVGAFNCGYEALGEIDYDFIAKLDCDLSFEPNYFDKLFGRFASDSNLGIASGVYFELDSKGSWNEIRMPEYHAAGACKVIRRKCFEQIGGFVGSPGWDTIDEIRAIACGWKITHFRDLQIKHHKPEGTGIGLLKTSAMHGRIYYLTGGSRLFFAFKLLHRLTQKPYFFNALALFKGYLAANLEQRTLLVSDTEASCYRNLLHGHLRSRLNALLTRRRP